jgi:diaminohydroxyphosphoribosylaminopyrimidine deaminase/5-amino-6-(5-phosphoribosylamino)uracil reductase
MSLGDSDGSAEDQRFMREALELAVQGRGLVSPNPLVGAVVVRDGAIVGGGYHRRAGEAHAEVDALAQAGPRARGGTLYVTLEPCNHHGRTPPCVHAILTAGIGRVVAAAADPNPRVRGGGADALRAAGIAVTLGCCEAEARAANRVFFTAVAEGRPHVTLKWAMTLDGKIAAFDGRSRWITGERARVEAHRLRSESDAVAVGIGTALADDPALDVRLSTPWPREPLRVVVDSRARLPVEARLIRAGQPSRVVVAVTDRAPVDRIARLEDQGVQILRAKSDGDRVDVADLAARLFALDVTAMLVEGGGELHASFVHARLVDRVAVFIAPKLIGGAAAPTSVAGHGLALPDALHLESSTARPLGPDWLIEGDVVRAAAGGEASGRERESERSEGRAAAGRAR